MPSNPERDLLNAFDETIKELESVSEAELEVSWPSLPQIPDMFTQGSPGDVTFDSQKMVDDVLRLATEAVAGRLKDLLDAKLVEYGLVDTGTLKNSLSINITNGEIDIQYSAPYAGLLHEGGYMLPYGNSSAEKVFVPGRPWINDVLRDFDYDKVVNDALRGYEAK